MLSVPSTSLEGPGVAAALEALSVLAGAPQARFVSRAPNRLRAARTCYDHIAGGLGVLLHDRFLALGWLAPEVRLKPDSAPRAHSGAIDGAYELTAAGEQAFAAAGIDVAATRGLRRRFAYACLDWSERTPHLGGALAAAVLSVTLRRRWVVQDLDSRALRVTSTGQRELKARFGLP